MSHNHKSNAAAAGSIDFAASALSTPSDEQQEGRESSVPQQQKQKQQHQQPQEMAEGYHSLPASGNALNVGRHRGGQEARNHEAPALKTKASGTSFITAMEQEQPFGDEEAAANQHTRGFGYGYGYGYSYAEASEFSSRVLDAASTASGVVWKTVLGGGEAFSSSLGKKALFVQACYLGIAAILGTLLRLVLAQLFGQACSNPETVGWIADESVLCVTSSGTTTQNEGIVFADLPANLLGSFLMGLLQDGAALGLAINLPIAWVKPSHVFQSMGVFHLALKTGFCGSLTTFSAWNSEMVVLLVGNHDAMPNRPSMVWRALFGYVVGMETAIGSYVFGRTVAWWLHKWVNPELAREQREMSVREKKHGIAINRDLPVVERRYLHGLFDRASRGGVGGNTDGPSSLSGPALSPSSTLTREELAPLHRWRQSTRDARRVESGLSEELVELETALIVRKEVPTQETRDMAIYHGWDIDGLLEWLSKRRCHTELLEASASLESLSREESDLSHARPLTAAGVAAPMDIDGTVWYELPVAATMLGACLLLLVNLMGHWDAGTSYQNTYRTMAYSMLFAPPGALLRWKLSSFNGRLGEYFSGRFHRWAWLPIGTLAANLLGAVVSISMIGWEYNLEMAATLGGRSGFWGIATVRAVKIGFSGCLSTVSTFVSEVYTLTQQRQDRGYKYILVTLVASAVAGMVLFVAIV